MQVNYQGHAAVYIETNSEEKLLIDPFFTGNPFASIDPSMVAVDYIILTHGHDDHVGDTVEIAKRSGAKVIAPVELAEFLAEQGIDSHGMNIGGSYHFSFGRVKFVQAFHSSSTVIDGKPVYLGPACGVIITADNRTIYHLGDTALFSDLKLIGQLDDIDLALIPIGSNFTMGPEDAILAAQMIKPKKAMPIHYNTFPVIEQDPKKFIDGLEGIEGLIPEIGEWISL